MKSQSTLVLSNRAFQSETSIQQKKMSYLQTGLPRNRSSYIDSLCHSFNLSAATSFSPFNNSKKKKVVKESTPTQQQPCKRCEKIRSSVKRFFRAKFETETPDEGTTKTSLTEPPNQFRMHIFEEKTDPITAIESHKTSDAAVSESDPNINVCFGCDQPKRESSIRGPPIISPVCTGNVSACPLGEIFKNSPERVKKVIKIDRPRSLGPRKRLMDKEQYRESSVHEVRKPRAH